MKKLLTILALVAATHTAVFAQRQCGFEMNRAALVAKDPSWAGKLEAQRASLQGVADNYLQQVRTDAAEKTTAASPIPVVFHFILDSAQYVQLGGVTGIDQRVNAQIAVLNQDFNRQNPDSVLIPYGWKHLYAAVGIRFGLAHTDPQGFGSPGYEIKIISSTPGGFSGSANNYSDAKHNTSGGLDAWDVTKYMNIWCLNFTDYPGLLGLTTFKTETGGSGFPADEEGLCINYGAVGKRTSTSDYYVSAGGAYYYDRGRTITHEAGHFFEIWHTWGDDGGLCPWNGGSDDGIADTPPEGGPKFDALPDTIPGGTYYDQCRYDVSNDTEFTLFGISSHDYMNYVDDVAMFMFTTDQAAAMAAQVAPGGESYTLTQNPGLLIWSSRTRLSTVAAEKSLNLSPNPTTGVINITYDNTLDDLKQADVFDILGRQVQTFQASGSGKDFYSIDISAMNKGIYFIRCNFASGSLTRKIILQ